MSDERHLLLDLCIIGDPVKKTWHVFPYSGAGCRILLLCCHVMLMNSHPCRCEGTHVGRTGKTARFLTCFQTVSTVASGKVNGLI